MGLYKVTFTLTSTAVTVELVSNDGTQAEVKPCYTPQNVTKRQKFLYLQVPSEAMPFVAVPCGCTAADIPVSSIKPNL